MKIEGTHGPVSITLIGVADVAKMLSNVYQDIEIMSNEQLIRSATLCAYEVQQSIMGLRGEERSVDTGNFANSIQTKSVDNNTVSVFSEVEYAPFLEFGTSKLPARAHFQNTAFRIEPNIKEEFNAVIKKICDKNK
jgi:phage gpG-like protein